MNPVDISRRRLAEWLLGHRVQLSEGPHRGAVVGAFDEKGRPRYAYAEITGYYLRWLAWRSGTDAAQDLRARASDAQSWLGRWASAGPWPATRVYLQDEQEALRQWIGMDDKFLRSVTESLLRASRAWYLRRGAYDLTVQQNLGRVASLL